MKQFLSIKYLSFRAKTWNLFLCHPRPDRGSMNKIFNWIPLFRGMTEENRGMTEENRGMTKTTSPSFKVAGCNEVKAMTPGRWDSRRKTQQKTRLSTSFLAVYTSDEVAPDLRGNTLPQNRDIVKFGVEVRGIEPPQPDFAGQVPHQSTPTSFTLSKLLNRVQNHLRGVKAHLGGVLLAMAFLVSLILPGSVLATNSSIFTLSLWVNPTTSVASKTILGKAEEFRMFTDASGFVGCQIKSTTWQTATQATTKALQVGSWSHVVCTYDLVKLTVFVDGSQVAQTSLTAVADDTANLLKIGQDDSASTPYSNLSGTIDEFKFYNYALTADEVKIEYNRGSSLVLGALGNNSTYQSNASNQEYCVPGDSLSSSCAAPVGRWDFNEGSGTKAYDTSGNGYDGTWAGTPRWAAGKYGKAVNLVTFNTDYIQANTALASAFPFTMSAWVNTTYTANPQALFYLDSISANVSAIGLALRETNGLDRLKCFNYIDSESRLLTGTKSLNDGKWHQLTGVLASSTLRLLYVDGVLDAIDTTRCNFDSTYLNRFTIGMNSSADGAKNGTVGKLDRVQIFTYARTPAQIAWDYNKGGPVGYWRFDECSGGTVKDYSGNAKNATITIGGSGEDTVGTCTTSSTAWGDGQTGKRNYSLKLDGIDDFLTTSAFSPLATAAQTTSTLSWGGWFYPTTAVASKTLLEKATEFQLTTDANSMPICGVYYTGAFHDSSAPTTALTLSAWNHVICTYDGTNINTYLNGKLIQQTAETTAVTAASSVLYMGETSTATNEYEGQLDDVRIYNYALSGTQVKLLMNNGAVNFGPVSGSP